jgi:hypothetical protein
MEDEDAIRAADSGHFPVDPSELEELRQVDSTDMADDEEEGEEEVPTAEDLNFIVGNRQVMMKWMSTPWRKSVKKNFRWKSRWKSFLQVRWKLRRARRLRHPSGESDVEQVERDALPAPRELVTNSVKPRQVIQ